MKWNIFTAIVSPVLVVIIGWALGFVKMPEDKPNIDYSYSTRPLFPSENNELLKKLQVYIQNKPVEDLNISTLEFINQTSKNLENINVQVKWPQQYKFLSSSKNIPKGYSEDVVKDTYNSTDSTIVYTIKKFDRSNISDSDREIISLNLLFLGESPKKEEIQISTSTKGIQFSDYEEKNKRKNNNVNVIVVVFLVLYALALVAGMVHGNRKSKSNKLKYEKKVRDYFDKNIIPYFDKNETSRQIKSDEIFKHIWSISLEVYNPRKFKKQKADQENNN